MSYFDTDENHPCAMDGCENNVQFDDEPYCFTHSPDEGSSVPGYSYKKSQQRAEAPKDVVFPDDDVPF